MKRVLIANRGEIAVRIIRACRDSGRTAIAVYADDDADALHVRLADEAYALQGARPRESYLDVTKILAAAKESNADAVHPGYGFLSESADFARAVIDAGLTWIGPAPEVIEKLGDKVAARKIAQSVDAPLVQGTPDPVSDANEAVDFAREHGLPIAIKAAHGGGGRGIRIAWDLDEVAELYDSAVREATEAFGRGECFVEQYLQNPRHVEVQILGDAHGNVVAVGTRDCSLQRRNQKLVEEAPAPFLTDKQRAELHSSAERICAEAGYQGAATVEFLLSTDGTLSFLEVNTRLQVEHPVTEETTGLDLVLEQFRIAEGEPLTHEVRTAGERAHGHAFEFRINAEDPGRGYLPTPGEISVFDAPSGGGIRVDSGYTVGQVLPGHFDSMLAKLIVWGPDRQRALARARRALDEFQIDGVSTVLPFHREVLQQPDFTGEDAFAVHTRWIENDLDVDFEPAQAPEPAAATSLTRTWLEIDGRRVQVGIPGMLLSGLASAGGSSSSVEKDSGGTVDEGSVTAPITGTLVSWKVDDGATVSRGEVVAVMEAMKMETNVVAESDGALSLTASAGDHYAAGTALGRIS
ncbi:acetyl/propionyl/methylcrotonyl-CoA carboxylase subunit alpha [Citricoccus sp. NR2]|uniref:acetyl/propionyl/methylcrotonyl-CoA carboxylase subunit alpha n=1 Tax=Citricoccus sp. NR2 TaxID=3004095 RepID=UPI0022DD3028|nr:biotin carboxylase N-terminal domain-containing protein [Citricoccus sp. NR2]WBL18076.1 ATP-grasp domain-containing protein [Citricoccus sp. NR2]